MDNILEHKLNVLLKKYDHLHEEIMLTYSNQKTIIIQAFFVVGALAYFIGVNWIKTEQSGIEIIILLLLVAVIPLLVEVVILCSAATFARRRRNARSMAILEDKLTCLLHHTDAEIEWFTTPRRFVKGLIGSGDVLGVLLFFFICLGLSIGMGIIYAGEHGLWFWFIWGIVIVVVAGIVVAIGIVVNVKNVNRIAREILASDPKEHKQKRATRNGL